MCDSSQPCRFHPGLFANVIHAVCDGPGRAAAFSGSFGDTEVVDAIMAKDSESGGAHSFAFVSIHLLNEGEHLASDVLFEFVGLRGESGK